MSDYDDSSFEDDLLSLSDLEDEEHSDELNDDDDEWNITWDTGEPIVRDPWELE